MVPSGTLSYMVTAPNQISRFIQERCRTNLRLFKNTDNFLKDGAQIFREFRCGQRISEFLGASATSLLSCPLPVLFESVRSSFLAVHAEDEAGTSPKRFSLLG
jgi:hypothetical protein